ncbi:MAG: DUF2752 domain-containing protein [Pirellulales bacterium]|nr:DUF2752 domain-containing protein [Pirellulales bacterium]
MTPEQTEIAEIRASSQSMSRRDRWLAALGAAVLAALVAAAATATPDPRGYGTHEQFGWGPCSFRDWTGFACPSCGMTTAWACLVRSDVARAAAANLAGAGLAVAALLGAPWLAWAAARGAWPWRRPRWDGVVYAGTVLLGVAALDWVRRLAVG